LTLLKMGPGNGKGNANRRKFASKRDQGVYVYTGK
jgi:hypothetical protein